MDMTREYLWVGDIEYRPIVSTWAEGVPCGIHWADGRYCVFTDSRYDTWHTNLRDAYCEYRRIIGGITKREYCKLRGLPYYCGRY